MPPVEPRPLSPPLQRVHTLLAFPIPFSSRTAIFTVFHLDAVSCVIFPMSHPYSAIFPHEIHWQSGKRSTAVWVDAGKGGRLGQVWHALEAATLAPGVCDGEPKERETVVKAATLQSRPTDEVVRSGGHQLLVPADDRGLRAPHRSHWSCWQDRCLVSLCPSQRFLNPFPSASVSPQYILLFSEALLDLHKSTRRPST